MPMWTCRPKIRFERATIFRSSTIMLVALIGIDGLLAPVGERMRGGGGQPETVFAGQLDNAAAEFGDIPAGFLDVLADAGADFDDRLVHLRLDLLLQETLALFDDLELDVRAEVAA